MTARIGSLCTGYGGLDAAVQAVIGGTLAWVADNDPAASTVLAHHHPHVPNLGDVTAVDWADVPPVDVLTGGYPCQPFSAAGKRKGTADERHLWPYIAVAVRVLRPRLAIFENVANHLGLGFDAVLADLAALGFDAEWRLVRASDVGAPHRRERLFVVAAPADSADLGHERGRLARGRRPGPAHGGVPAADAEGDGRHEGRTEPARIVGGPDAALSGTAWGAYGPAIRRWENVLGRPAPRPTEPERTGERLSPLFVEWLMGLPAGHVTAVPGLSRNQMLRLLGNGVVPQQGAAAVADLLDRMEVAA